MVGNSTDCRGNSLAAVIWKHGMAVDLNTLIIPWSFYLTNVTSINDRGEIIGEGVLRDGSHRNFLLVPNRG